MPVKQKFHAYETFVSQAWNNYYAPFLFDILPDLGQVFFHSFRILVLDDFL